jgi:hypothetical protein
MRIRIIVYSRERWLEVGTYEGWRHVLRSLRDRRACGLKQWMLLPSADNPPSRRRGIIAPNYVPSALLAQQPKSYYYVPLVLLTKK